MASSYFDEWSQPEPQDGPPKRSLFDEWSQIEPEPESLGFVEGLKQGGRGLIRGVVEGLPSAVAGLVDYADTPAFDESGKQVEDTGASEWARGVEASAKARGAGWEESEDSRRLRESNAASISGNMYEAMRMFPLSFGPGLAGAATGAAIGSVVPVIGTLGGAGAGFLAGSIAALPLFFGQQAKDTYDKVTAQTRADNPALTDEQVHDKAMKAGAFTGFIEAGGELVADLVGAKLFKMLPGAVKGQLAKSATKAFMGVKPMLAGMAKVLGAEVGTELAQGASQAEVEKAYGVGEGANVQDLKGVIMPTILMSLVGGGAASGMSAKMRYDTAKLLENPNADPSARMGAAQSIAKVIGEQDAELGTLFMQEATKQISQGKPVIAENDQFYKDLKLEPAANEVAPNPEADAMVQAGIISRLMGAHTIDDALSTALNQVDATNETPTDLSNYLDTQSAFIPSEAFARPEDPSLAVSGPPEGTVPFYHNPFAQQMPVLPMAVDDERNKRRADIPYEPPAPELSPAPMPVSGDQLLSWKKAAYQAASETQDATDDTASRMVLGFQEKANERGEPMAMWRSATGTIGLVPASQQSPFKDGEKIAEFHPEHTDQGNAIDYTPSGIIGSRAPNLGLVPLDGQQALPQEPTVEAKADILPPISYTPPPKAEIRKSDGTPFASERSVKASGAWRALPETERANYTISPVDGGFVAVRKPEAKEKPSQTEQRQEIDVPRGTASHTAIPPATTVQGAIQPSASATPALEADALSGLARSLQNRNRDSAASVQQMTAIAAKPDADLLMASPTLETGAPAVTDLGSRNLVPPEARGLSGRITLGGEKVPFQYAVVEADSLLPSNNVDGTANKDYAENLDRLTAITNGRTAGLQGAYARGNAQEYRDAIADAQAMHGIAPEVMAGMKSPVLVRVIDAGNIPANVGDLSNTKGTLGLSPLEQARTDATRFDIAGIELTDDGRVTPQSLRSFVAAMPASELQELAPNGAPTPAAVTRLRNAAFFTAYRSNELVREMSESTDPDSANILNGMTKAASSMAKLDGTGEYDIRGVVAEAAQRALTASRHGRSIKDALEQRDIDDHPWVRGVMQMFADNIRSAKKIGEKLDNLASAAYAEAHVNDEVGMFGDAPQRPVSQLIEEQLDVNLEGGSQQPDAGTAAETGQSGGNVPASVDDGRGTQAAERPAEQPAGGDRAGAQGEGTTNAVSPADIEPEDGDEVSFDEYIRRNEARRAADIAAIGDVDGAAIVKSKQGERWVMILPDVDGGGKWRTQSFDANGFSGHMVFDSKEKAIEDAAQSGYTQRDDGALDRVQNTPAFARGMYWADLIQQVNSGAIKHADLNRLMDEYDAKQNAVPAKTEPANEAPAKSNWGANNKLVTQDRAEELRKRLLERSKRLRSGLDPEDFQLAAELATFHIEAGGRAFADFAKAMLKDLGEWIRPHLRALYEYNRYGPASSLNADMTPVAEADKIDVGAIALDPESAGEYAENDGQRQTAPKGKEVSDVQRSGGNLESDSGNAADGNAAVVTPSKAGSTAVERPTGRRDESNQGAEQGGAGFRNGGAVAAGERGHQPVDSGERVAPHEVSAAGSAVDFGGGQLGLDGIQSDGDGARAPGGPSALGSPERARAQRDAERIGVKPGDLQNIKDTLPFLIPGQQEDTYKAEQRFAKPDGYGILFTNGTGTGKTFSGLGIIKRFAKQGKTNILIAAPNDKIMDDWIASAAKLGLTVNRLPDTKSAGRGIVISTYANLGANDAIVRREWDLVVADEAHNLSQGKNGDPTAALQNIRAITLHPDGVTARTRALHRDLYDKASSLDAKIKMLESGNTNDRTFVNRLAEELTEIYKAIDKATKAVAEDVSARQGAARPRAVFLSATPFAYEKSIDWAEGYLFDYALPGARQDGARYNSGNARDQFFMTHFGYRMRYNKLTEPGPEVDRGIMQRQFNTMLKKAGVLSNRLLEVEPDYDRRFVLVDSLIGRRIDDAFAFIDTKRNEARDADNQDGVVAWDEIRGFLGDKFDYLSRRYLLEAIKASEAVVHVREHMALGRKVVVFHDYKKGGGFNPFDLRDIANEPGTPSDTREAIYEFSEAFKDLVESGLHKMSSPIDVFRREFPDVLLINGNEKKADILNRYRRFNDDNSGPQVMLVQSAKSAGWSGHDTTGKHQRVLLNLGQPTAPTTAIQQEGRIYRAGQASNAIIRYFNTGTNWERWTFASTIAQRASAAENLAMGEAARALKDSFIEAFEESSSEYHAGHEGEGIGGKERDRMANAAITEWDRAKTLYFGQKKRNSKNKSEEGADYFATPEPLGVKMVEWAGLREGEAGLEPSAGHGAIARWLPDNATLTAIEPSNELRSRLALVFDGKIVDSTFEDLHITNKYDAIVMNPPFGSGGKTAVDHVAKAAQHLREGGRIVALIPRGPAADKKFDKWFYEEDERPMKPLYTHPEHGPIYENDTLTMDAFGNDLVIAGPLSIDGTGDSPRYVRQKGESKGTAVNLTALKAIRPGKRTESYAPAAGLHLVADITLPTATFERAGTSVAARVVVIDKRSDLSAGQVSRDYSDAETIGAFFDRIEHASVPDRAAPAKPERAALVSGGRGAVLPAAGAPVAADGPVYTTDAAEITYVTKKGKAIQGVIAKDLTKEQAQAIDPYTWAKDGGFFIRMKHVQRPGSGSDFSDAGVASRRAKYGTARDNATADLFSDPYENTPTRPGTTEAQRMVGRAAVDDLSRRIGIHSVGLRYNQDGSTAEVLGFRFAANFVAGKPNSLVGQTIASPKDLAHLAQVYRDPRFETLRLFFIKDGKVAGEAGYSSRLPGAVLFPLDLEDQVRADMARFGAQFYYVLHNHPSGASSPSRDDINFTRKIADRIIGMLGHVVIDHNEFSTIDSNGVTATHTGFDWATETFTDTPAVAHPILGRAVTQPEMVAAIAKELQVREDMTAVVMTDAQGRVQLITSIPVSVFTDSSKPALLRQRVLLRRMARGSGSGGHRFLVLSRPHKNLMPSLLMNEGLFTDIVDSSGYSEASAGGWYNTRKDVAREGGKRMRVAEQDDFLSSYAQADLEQRAADEKARAKKEAAEKAKRDAKREADAALGEFTLTGSDSATDQAAARGQQPLFSRADRPAGPGRHTRAANQTSAKILNAAMVKYGLGQQWENAFETVAVSDALSSFGQEIQTAFGRNVRFVAPTAARFDVFDGAYLLQAPTAVYVNVNAPRNLTAIAGHEIYHALERDRPDLHAWLKDQLQSHVQGLDEYTAKLNKLLQPGEKPYGEDAAISELLSDFTGDALSDPAFLQQLADANPSKFKRLLKAVMAYLEQAIANLRGLGSSKYISDVQAMRDSLAAALNAYAEGGDIVAAVSEVSDNVVSLAGRAKKDTFITHAQAQNFRGDWDQGTLNRLEARRDAVQAELDELTSDEVARKRNADKIAKKREELRAAEANANEYRAIWEEQLAAWPALRIDEIIRERGKVREAYLAWQREQPREYSPTRTEKEERARANYMRVLAEEKAFAGAELARREGRAPVYLSRQAPIWVSRLKQRIIEQGNKTRTAKEWSQWINANKSKLGVKQQEIEWSGINDYLNAAGKEKLSGADIASWLDQNGVQVTETILSEYVGTVASRAARSLDDMGFDVERTVDEDNQDWDEYGPDPTPSAIIERATGAVYHMDDIINGKYDDVLPDSALMQVRDLLDGDVRDENALTRFNQYQFPGGENYRELLLTLPARPMQIEATPEQRAYFDHVDRMQEQYGNNWRNVASLTDRVKTGELERAARASAPHDTVGRNAIVSPRQDRGNFQSPHFEQPNIIAHIRFNERTDANGNRVLFIEEIQSDWGQKGREHGFGRTDMGDALNALVEAAGRPHEKQPPIPSAPFVTDTKAWVALSLKRMIRYAVDNGFDAVAWTTGEQQADRYSLATQVLSVAWIGRHNDAEKSVAIETIDGRDITFTLRPDGTVGGVMSGGAGARLEGKRIDEVVGKELGERMLSETHGDVRGDGLEIGGEGMQVFYDEILPQVARDVLKKLGGGKVEPQPIEFPVYADIFVREHPGFSITDTIRDLASQGMPLFSRTPSPINEALSAQTKSRTPTVWRAWLQSNFTAAQIQQSGILAHLATLGPNRVTGAQIVASMGNVPPRPVVTAMQQTTSAPVSQEALEKLGLASKPALRLSKRIHAIVQGDMRRMAKEIGARAYEGLFDGLVGLDRAEREVGITAPAQSGYVGARMSTSVSDLMTAILKYGAPQWQDGGIQHKQGTIGLLDIVTDLGTDLQGWLGWMAGNRAQELIAQGRENNLTQDDITALRAGAVGKEAKFIKAKDQYSALNKAMLDFAEVAGLINPESRQSWESEWYVPFYRVSEDETLLAPRTKRGLSHQSSGIKALRGSELPTNDLLENILVNWVKLADSATKNAALLKGVDNLKGSRFITDETLKFKQVIVPRSEIVKRIKADRAYVEMMADMLGIPDASEVEVLHEIASLDQSGLENLWALVAPTDPDIVRVRRGGKSEYYRVNDKALLRAVSHLGFAGFNDPVTRSMRWFKRLLTTGVTASPDFMFRNFVRDAAHAWAINRDGFTFGKDSITGLAKAIQEDEDYRALMFEMGSFQGGYVHGTDPEASAQIIRRSLGAKGLRGAALDAHLGSVLNTPAKLWDTVQQGWQKYRGLGDKIENANRLATYKAALKAGKHPLQAAFEAKDLMDYSRRGNFQALMWFTDVVPFLNARLQGMDRLARSSADHGKLSKVFAARFAQIAAFSILLAMLNDDNDDYKALNDWEKDAYWHVWIGDQHFRIPKPFELGILAGTIPERMYRTWVSGSQPSDKLRWALMHGLMETMNFNPIPQIALPAIEVWGNRSFYFDSPIEGMGDARKLPQARYNERTSETMKQVGSWLGMSPKKLEHLWVGYTGTIGAYVLSAADMAARAAVGAPDRPAMRAGDVIGLKSFYRGTDVPYSTQYETDLYDRLEEVEQLYSTINAYRREGLPEKAQELRMTGMEKLRYRKMLAGTSERINFLRKRIAMVSRNDGLDADEKRTEIDRLLAIKNQLAQRVSERTEDVF